MENREKLSININILFPVLNNGYTSDPIEAPNYYLQ